MANGTTSYSDWMQQNPEVVGQVNQQFARPDVAPVVTAEAPPPAGQQPSAYAATFDKRYPVMDTEEMGKAERSDELNATPGMTREQAEAEEKRKSGKSGAMGKVLGLVGTFFGGPIGAVLGSAAGLIGDKSKEDGTTSGAGAAGQQRRSSVAQSYLSSFIKR